MLWEAFLRDLSEIAELSGVVKGHKYAALRIFSQGEVLYQNPPVQTEFFFQGYNRHPWIFNVLGKTTVC